MVEKPEGSGKKRNRPSPSASRQAVRAKVCKLASAQPYLVRSANVWYTLPR